MSKAVTQNRETCPEGDHAKNDDVIIQVIFFFFLAGGATIFRDIVFSFGI